MKNKMKTLKMKNSNRDKKCLGWLTDRTDVAKEITSALGDKSEEIFQTES